MPWPIYSERFLKVTAPIAWQEYTVPGGKRAIIRSIVAVNDYPQAAKVYVQAAGTPLLVVSFPAQTQSQAMDVYVVVYSGEIIRAYMEQAFMAVTISGYLLTQPAGTSEDPPEPSDEGSGEPDWIRDTRDVP